MYRFLPVIIVFIIGFFCSCQSNESAEQQKQKIEKLPATIYSIDTRKDTLLKTAKGALIFIQQGALMGDAPIVQLAVREAYSISDIVMAGLITLSRGNPLSSGGMIQILPADKKVKMVKPLSVSLPTDFYRKNMQVFKGNELPDGIIDWIDPKPIKPDTGSMIAQGERIFRVNCQSCHYPLKDATGPALAYLFQRRDKEWLKKFVRNPAIMMASGDPYSKALFCAWGPAIMPAFASLSDADFDKLDCFINNESQKIDPVSVPDTKKGYDSCEVYLRARAVLAGKSGLANHEKKRQRLINDPASNGSGIPEVIYKQDSIHNYNPEGLVSPNTKDAVYYQFTIDTYGWYNVDFLLTNIPEEFKPSLLEVTITGGYKDGLNVYLVIPADKIFIAGGPLLGKDATYAFFTQDGKIPLPQNRNAYIIAFSDIKGQIVYNALEFKTTLQNKLSFSLTKTSKEAFNSAIKKLDIKDLPITVEDTKNADAIRREDAVIEAIMKNKDFLKLEKRKPRNFPCPCGGAESGNQL